MSGVVALHRVVRALEALEDHEFDLAQAILEDAVRECSSIRPGFRCGDCGRWFQWPGLRDAHLCSDWRAEAAA